MDFIHRRGRWGWPALAVVIALSVVTLLPGLGYTNAVRSPLWTDRLASEPSPATITAPNWPEIAKLLKPAVVNVSTKRPAEAASMPPGTPGDRDPFNDFFNHFRGNQPPDRKSVV